MSQSKVQQVLDLARAAGVLRPRDLEAQGIHREYLRRLERQGLLIRSGRGIYTPLDADFTEHHSLVEATQRVSHSIVCLLSALRFHEITTQAPFEIWLAIHGKAHTPREKLIPLHIVYMSGNAFESGIETHQLEGMPVQIYNLPKTVADCFKYRNKIGLDIALEALRESWRDRRCTMDELWHYAKICRVSNVMRPYLESLT
ncbi:type IV toxin-antitoxin system AbiEi family antitoxin domain-containing protein [Altericista sp. CCNU0014]|uniref:type IV toxin-antitoxin system AbiEi family antitoxin domain-containing protein n=1 Tax=Altericista sp. CCNU0014 TaxID=3082949 RepID=UPI00384FACA3